MVIVTTVLTLPRSRWSCNTIIYRRPYTAESSESWNWQAI